MPLDENFDPNDTEGVGKQIKEAMVELEEIIKNLTIDECFTQLIASAKDSIPSYKEVLIDLDKLFKDNGIKELPKRLSKNIKMLSAFPVTTLVVIGSVLKKYRDENKKC